MSESDLRPPSPSSAETLGGRWEVHAVLSGAMGTVLILVDPASGGRFAAKTPGAGREVATDALRRFQVEARTWMSLGHHENVVEAFFLEEIEWRGRPRPFLFLEFVDGPTLAALLEAEGRIAVPAALDLATGMAWGMAHAHGEGRDGPRIVHRDLKPENVFVTKNRVVKVSDFGIARALDRPEETAGEGAGLGTPHYAAPEQMKDARSADVRSDVYSFGALLFHLLTGEPPFPARDLSSLVRRVLREPARAPSSAAPGVPAELDGIVLACLAKQPSQRPRDFTEILERVSAVREIDSLWAAPPGTRSCTACGWLTASKNRACPLCGKRTVKGARYAPASRRHDAAMPTLGRASGEGRVVVEGVEIRPRVPRAGDELVVTVLLGNPSGTPVERVFVPYAVPDKDAFARVGGAAGRGFRGTVPPTAPGAPIRVSWNIRPLREGSYRLRSVRASYRIGTGRRRSAKSEPLDVVVGRGEVAPLVGRREESARLTALLEAASQGRAATAVLLGGTGAGKSRLARSLRTPAEERGFAWARGRCLDRGVEARGALKEALRQLLGLPRGASPAPQVAAAVFELLGSDARSEPGLPQFLVDELLLRAGEPGESPVHLWARFAAAAARRRPFVLVLEDVHVDPEVGAVALHMAEHAKREGARFLVAMTARPELEGGEFADAVRAAEEDPASADVAVVRLGPLDAADAEALVNEAFAPNDFAATAPWLAREMASLSGGNPEFLTSLVESMKTHGEEKTALVRTEGGRWTAAPDLTPHRLREIVPRRLGEAVLSRVAELPEEAGAFAAAAAVLGDASETSSLRRILGDPPSFERSLGTLETAGVLRETPGDPPRIRFREPLVREVLARELETANPDEYRRLHGAAADLIAAGPQARGRDALRLARHLVGAERGPEAMAPLLAAARRFVDRQAYRRAADVLAEAGRLVAAGAPVRRDDRVAFSMLRGEALRYSGDYAGALAAYREVVDADASTRPDEDVLATAYSKMGKVHEALGQADEALYCFAVGLSLRRETGRSRDVPLSLVNLAGLHAARGEPQRAEEYLASAVAEARVVGNHKALARASALAARLAAGRGETREARVHVRRALSEARTAKDTGAKADAWTMLGHANFRDGRAPRALSHFRRALRLRQEIGDLAAVGTSWSDVGAAHEAAGEIESAVLAYRRAAEAARRIGSRKGLLVALTNLGRGQLEAGFPRKAREILTEALESGRLAGNPPGAACTLADLAKAARFVGDLDEGKRLLDEALARARGCGDHDIEAYVAIESAESHAARGDASEAVAESRTAAARPGVSPDLRIALLSLAAELSLDRAEADAAARLAARSAGHWSRARALLAQARVEAKTGDADEAAALLRRAAGALLNSDVRETLLLAVLVEQARLLAERDPAAAEAARVRAAELAAALRGRGYAAGPGTGFPLDASVGEA